MLEDEHFIPLAALMMDEDTALSRHRRRCLIAANLAQVLAYILQVGIIEPREPHPTLYEWEKIQRKHILKYMRLAQNPELDEWERAEGGKIDKISLQCCDAAARLREIKQNQAARAYRKQREAEQEAKRQARLLQRRIREAERQIASRPRTRAKTKGEHVEVELCSKCGKRPAKSNHLCNPCLQWEQAKFGRS